MMRFGLHILFVITTFLPAVVHHELQEDLAVIVHESVDTGSISKSDLLEIYTLGRQNWRDDTRIVVSDYKGNSESRAIFYKYLETRKSNIQKLWLRAQFTGRTTPPVIVKTVDEMIEQVLERPGTIGYVPISEVPEGAKVLVRIKYDQ